MPRWSDHFTRKAKDAGYGARSVYKLEEIQRRARVIPRGGVALDLGCAPGSWSRYLRAQGVRHVVGVDLQPVKAFPGVFMVADVLEVSPETLAEALGGPADLVVSDMAPATTGTPARDHLAQVELARRALALAEQVLRPGGAFVVKVFEGAEAQAFALEVKQRFTSMRRIRPEATRKHSVEFFVVATGFRGRDPGG